MELSEMQHTEEQDKRVIEEILDFAGLPPEIAAFDVDFRDDHSGTPVLYLSFRLRPDVKLDHEPLVRISGFISEVQLTLLKKGLSRFPYASLDEAA